MYYDQPLFRPPSEAKSLILQITYGCSWNKCSFCEMYTSKKFSTRPFKDIKNDIDQAKKEFPNPKKIFLADGDAFVLAATKMISVLEYLKQEFPEVTQISSYATPQNILKKSKKNLSLIQQAGLDMLYYGVESGNDVVLQKICKGVDAKGVIQGIVMAKEAGYKVSTTNLLGIAGKKYTKEHALDTAKVLSESNPDYISFLMLMFPMGEDRFRKCFGNDYEPLTQYELITELRETLVNLNVIRSEIRANHASNYLPIKALFPYEKDEIIKLIDKVLSTPNSPLLRPEFMRGL